MQLFFQPNIKNELKLSDEEARHCFNVLRKKLGDEITIIDGKGSFYKCEIIDDNLKKNKLKILSENQERQNDKYIHLVVSPTKNMDRNEWMVEKAIEIGVSEITFILTSNSERRNLKIERLKKKAISAMKQSVRASIPKINELISVKSFLIIVENKSRLIAHITPKTKKMDLELIHQAGNDVCIMIGAEGGFTEEEVQKSIEDGFTPISLGYNRLRTETAAIFSVSLLNQ